MSIVFVSGPACAGKSTYIKENFPDRKVIDLYNYQKGKWISVQSIMQSYEDCMEDLVSAIKNGEKVVLEHTLLKAIRRKPYIDAIRAVTDEDIEMYFIIPEPKEFNRRKRLRGSIVDDDFIDDAYEIMDIPTKEEGFSKVVVIKDVYKED